MLRIVLPALVVVVIALLFGFSPRRTTIAEGQLHVVSPLRTWCFPLQTLTQVEPAKLNQLATIRLCASGWPLPPNGWIWNRTQGIFRALASSHENLYLLHFSDRSPLLVSLPALNDLLAVKLEIDAPAVPTPV